jgi:hypothetical protein
MPESEYLNLKKIMGKIKRSNFDLGESNTDYKTSFNDSYNFNAEKAIKGRGVLDAFKIKDLKATHYSLGNDNNNFTTSTSNTYKPLNIKPFHRHDNQEVKKSSIDFNNQSNVKETDRMTSLYMADFVKKAIVD